MKPSLNAFTSAVFFWSVPKSLVESIIRLTHFPVFLDPWLRLLNRYTHFVIDAFESVPEYLWEINGEVTGKENGKSAQKSLVVLDPLCPKALSIRPCPGVFNHEEH